MYSNLITAEKFNNFSKDEKYLFYLKNKIYRPFDDTKEEYWREEAVFTSGLRRAMNTELPLFYLFHRISEEFLKEIYEDFNAHFRILDVFGTTEKIKIEVSTMLGNKNKIKFLEKKHRKHSKKLNKNETYFWYCLDDEDHAEYGHKDFEEYVIYEISGNFREKYITNEHNYYREKIFRDIIEIKEELEILSYIENLKLKIETEKETKINYELKETGFTLMQQLFVLEEIRNLDTEKWLSIPNTKKSKLLSLLFYKSSENIRKSLPLLEGSVSKLSLQQKKDLKHVQTILNNVLG